MLAQDQGSCSPGVRWVRQLEKVRVIVADDHPGFPEIIEGLLKSEFQIIGKVMDGEALVKETMKLNPDIVVTDISMPVINGIEAPERLKELTARFFDSSCGLGLHTNVHVRSCIRIRCEIASCF
jgi:DNA-binding NarL/FixJ family response regulator